MRDRSVIAFLGLFWILAAGESALAQTYKITDLGFLPGASYSTASGINQKGQVIAISIPPYDFPPPGVPYSFLYTDGKMVPLDFIAHGIAGGEGKERWAGDEDTRKLRIAGTELLLYIIYSEAVLHQDNLDSPLGFEGGVPPYSGANAVNSSGAVVGFSTDNTGELRPVLWKNGNLTDLGTIDGGAGGVAMGINDHGDVTGFGYLGLGPIPYHTFLYHNNTMTDLGTLPGGDLSMGTSINESLQITGYSSSSVGAFLRAFLWSKGKLTDLGALPGETQSYANSINNWGEVVGSSANRGFFYGHGQMRDLNDMIPSDSGWVILEGNGINDRGEIAATASRMNNQIQHAVLLTLDCKDLRNRNCDSCRR